MSENKIHYAKTAFNDQVYQVFYNDEFILESHQTIEVTEHYNGKAYPPVIYFPLIRRLQS